MDKFTKTTEVDISSMHAVEEDTPKTSKASKIVAVIICLLLSVGIWLYVTETDMTAYEKTFDGVSVVFNNADPKFNIVAEEVSVVVSATRSQLVNLDKQDIVVEIEAQGITEAGEYRLQIKDIHIDGPSDIKVKSSRPDEVKVSVTVK